MDLDWLAEAGIWQGSSDLDSQYISVQTQNIFDSIEANSQTYPGQGAAQHITSSRMCR